MVPLCGLILYPAKLRPCRDPHLEAKPSGTGRVFTERSYLSLLRSLACDLQNVPQTHCPLARVWERWGLVTVPAARSLGALLRARWPSTLPPSLPGVPSVPLSGPLPGLLPASATLKAITSKRDQPLPYL